MYKVYQVKLGDTIESIAEMFNITALELEKLNGINELVDFADKLEKACIDTIEAGKMTKDLALLTDEKNPTVLNSRDFIVAVRETLDKLL